MRRKYYSTYLAQQQLLEDVAANTGGTLAAADPTGATLPAVPVDERIAAGSSRSLFLLIASRL